MSSLIGDYFKASRARNNREKVVAADSVTFRRPGRIASATPYISQGEAATTVLQPTQGSAAISQSIESSRAPRVDDSDSDSDSDTMEYIDVDLATTTGIEAEYIRKVGLEFDDADDNVCFLIVGVCREDAPGRRKSFAKLFYKYREVNKLDGELHYTPCLELINSRWCRWRQSTTATARDKRIAERQYPSQSSSSSSSSTQKQTRNVEMPYQYTRVTRSKR